jgi:predicted polyphosphate/ATP-dependent NAD kinase
MEAGRLYLLGPGSTVAQVGAALGIAGSVLGVDAVLDRRLIAADAGESQLLALLAEYPAATLILGVVGGQGFLLGRGNQQLSAAVLAAVGPDNIEIIASAGKLAGLDPPVLRIDLDDPELGARLSGYRRVRTAARHSTVMRVVA